MEQVQLPRTATLQSDDPLTEPDQDLFDRADFARRIASTISQRADDSSLVVGVFGPWGDGKTTVLNFIESALMTDSAFTTVRFNPWLIGDESQLLPAFFAAASAELRVSPGGKRRKLADRLAAYGDALSATSIDVLALGVDPGKAAQAASRLLAASSLEQRRREFEEALRAANRRVVIFLDDIDRLDTREIRAVFRLIRLAAPFQRVVYLVACDDRAVARALRDVHGGDASSGDDFLEKIVQVPLHIPPASAAALRGVAFRGLDDILRATSSKLMDSDAREIGSRYIQGLEPGLRTPRSLKRFLNAVSFAGPMLGEEANIPDVIAVEGIRTGYPSIYRALREHPEWFLVDRPYYGDPDPQNARVRQQIETEVLAGLPGDERGGATYLLGQLFPAIGAAFGGHDAPSREELYAQRRVGHPDYFARYFTYSVGTDGVAEREIRELLDAPPNEVAARLMSLMREKGREVLAPITKKVGVRLSTIQAETAGALVSILPLLGSAVVGKPGSGSIAFGSGADELAVLITRLVHRLPEELRFQAAAAVVQEAIPLTFAMDSLRWLTQPPHPGLDRMFTPPQLDTLSQSLADRIALALTITPLWETEANWAGLLSIATQGTRQQLVRHRVAGWLRDNPSNVDVLLAGVAGTAINLGNGQTIQRDFTTDSYALLGKLVALTPVRQALRITHGRVDGSTYPPDASYVEDPIGALVGQFTFLDAKARRERRAG